MDNKAFVIGIIICFLLSCSVGLERQYRRRFIGLRTTILVSIGAYMFVSMSFIVAGRDVDITRIAAGVVSGISFLGAGVIVKEGSKIQGLTTAATLWCDAAIGVLCATGAYVEAAIGTLIILLVNLVLRPFNLYLKKKTYDSKSRETYDITLNVYSAVAGTLNNHINGFIKEHAKCEIEVENIRFVKNKNNNTSMEIILSLKTVYDEFIDQLITEISKFDGVSKIEYKKIGDFLALDEEF